MSGETERYEALTTRELDARIGEVQRAVDLAREKDPQPVQLREYVEALFAEALRATEIAEREREKAAITLRTEVQRVAEMAERERSKAADALSETTTQSIRDGDLHLRQHVDQSYGQITAALGAAQRETQILHDASEKAIAKAEAANEKRFESVNAFRSQLSAQNGSFLLREVAEGQFGRVEALVAENTRRIDLMEGKSAGISASVGLMLAVATVVIGFVVLIANGTF